MRVKAWGTRGSIAVSNADTVRYGGNTTCYEIISECLPPNTKLVMDAGTGFVPCGHHYLSLVNEGLKYVVLLSHQHHDHIQGLTLSPPTFIEQVQMQVYGPVENGIGPKEMLRDLFRRPYFPVDAKRILHKTNCTPLVDFDVHVIVVHPEGGFTTLSLDKFKTLMAKSQQIPFGRKGKFDINDCLVVRMSPANHGDSVTISYRFEERPTGRVLAILTDNEDQVSVPLAMRQHLAGAHLAIIDAQYPLQRYLASTGGYGHGTPTGVIKLAMICGLERVLFTHHDPQSTDKVLEERILAEGLQALESLSTDTSFLETFNAKDVLLTPENLELAKDYAEYDV